MASWTEHGCKVCNRDERDRAGNIKHEAWCPHFMRGPDAGGDPHEWPTLLEDLAGRLDVHPPTTKEA